MSGHTEAGHVRRMLACLGILPYKEQAMSKDEQINVSVPVSVGDIDEAFSRLIIQSKLGEEISKQIGQVLAPGSYDMGNIVQKAVKLAVSQIVAQLVREQIKEHTAEITAIIAEKITAEFIADAVNKHWNHVCGQM